MTLPFSFRQISLGIFTFWSVVFSMGFEANAQTGANGGPLFQKGFPVPQTHAAEG